MADYIEKATKNLNTLEMITFSEMYRKARKKKKVAFLLWLIGGAFGLHRFYLNSKSVGVAILLTTIFSLGLLSIVGFIDGVNIPRLTRESNKELTLKLVKTVKRV